MTRLLQEPTTPGRRPGAEVWVTDGVVRVRVSDSRGLAALLREAGAPGARSMTAINRLRKQRAENRVMVEPSLRARVEARRRERLEVETESWRDVVAERGGETEIRGDRESWQLQIAHRGDDLLLLACAGWRQYSRAFGARRASLAYLCGVDDNGRWAARVPGTCATVWDANAALEPAEVKAAREAGRAVLRQGDVYLVELGPRARSYDDGTPAIINGSHRWDGRTLRHEPGAGQASHAPITVPESWSHVRLVPQREFASNRGWTRD